MNEEKISFPTMAVLGSTGSVGQQALDVARMHHVRVDAMSAGSNTALAEAQIREFAPDMFAMADEKAAAELRVRVADTKTRVLSGSEGICEMISASSAEVVLNSILGEAGLVPTLAVIDSGKRLALANKESLVVAGELVMARARAQRTVILPVDSEHCAIDQCLRAGRKQDVKRLLLTASGGPFFGYASGKLRDMSVREALAHPTWKMGAKITVDSATLMNKGFEVIEAVHLFGVTPEQVKVIVQRESIIHSMVEYVDNSIIAQLSVPDMRLCVQNALTFPARAVSPLEELDFAKLSRITFYGPDMETFVLLPCAIRAIGAGGAVPAVVNAANEVAVAHFLRDEIRVGDIFDTVCGVTEHMCHAASHVRDLEGILGADREARRAAENFLQKRVSHT